MRQIGVELTRVRGSLMAKGRLVSPTHTSEWSYPLCPARLRARVKIGKALSLTVPVIRSKQLKMQVNMHSTQSKRTAQNLRLCPSTPARIHTRTHARTHNTRKRAGKHARAHR